LNVCTYLNKVLPGMGTECEGMIPWHSPHPLNRLNQNYICGITWNMADTSLHTQKPSKS